MRASRKKLLKDTQPIKRPHSRSRQLVVIMHGSNSTSLDLKDVRSAVEEGLPDADLMMPTYPSRWYSSADPIRISEALVHAISEAVEDQAKSEPYKDIILVGHSMGALLVRKAYVYARGQTQDWNPESPIRPKPRTWTSQVNRIILLAGLNRGWNIDKRPQNVRLYMWIGMQFLLLHMAMVSMGQANKQCPPRSAFHHQFTYPVDQPRQCGN